MFADAVPSLLQHVRRLAASASSDEQLLADFLARRSDEAFAALLGRHGPMVLNVCRRILHDAHAAEDVFQATFLILADRAGAVRRRASLAGFLHGVAYRLAVRARRRSMSGLPAAVYDRAAAVPEGLAWQEMLGILDHELGRLSDRYRAPLVLCYLEGRTQDEAARQLGWGLNTLRRRLAQGRRLLEARLRGRGVSLPTALAGLLAASAVAVPADLRAATLAAAGARAASGLTAGASALTVARNGLAFLLGTSRRKLGAALALAVLGAVVCFGYCLSVPADQPPPAEPPAAPPPAVAGRHDPATDPLPAGAAVRLGTGRYRHGSRIESFAVSADGRLAATASGWGVYHNPPEAFSPARVFDLTDGRCLYSLPNRPGSYTEAVGLSPDGKTLATKDDRFLSFRDAATGKEIRRVKYLPEAGGGRSVTDWVTFTPDGKRAAAVLMGDGVRLIDVGTGEVTRTFQTRAPVVFSPDGQLMAAGGYDAADKVQFARLWEVATGKELRRFAVSHDIQQSITALAFSPDGATIASASWRDARLRLWETATGKELRAFPDAAADIASVAFAPDGKTVAAAADAIRLYDPATGKERLRIERRARGLAFSRDGSVLTGAVSGAIYRWDPASGRQLTPSAAQDSAVGQIVVSADGRSLFTTDRDGDLYLWDAAGGKAPRRIAGGIERGIVASPDGRFLAWAGKDAKSGGNRLWLYDVAGRRVIDRFGAWAIEDSVVGFLPDGKTLLTLSHAGEPAVVRLWDVESGTKGRSFAVEPDALLLSQSSVFTTRRAVLSPDGRTLAIGLEWEAALRPDRLRVEHRDVPVRLFDVATGKAGRKLEEPVDGANVPHEAGTGDLTDLGGLVHVHRKMKSADGRAFSPDGRFLADWAENPFGPSRMDHVCVWDTATGRLVASLADGPRSGAANAAFAPDGRTFATASADGVIRLWEVATWKVRAEFRGHRDRVTALAFGPDGRLFSGGLDTVVLEWDVRPPRDAAGGALAEAWEALASPDARKGFQAQGRFLAEPARAVEWLTARLAPAERPDPARLKALIADLDSDDFATRERATAGLKDYGPPAAAALREAAAKSASAEARRRAADLLRDVENGAIPARELRALRAVEVLEWVATREARARLLDLSKGAPGARLTREAAAACRRLEARK